jgi:hypothetical protein
VHGEEPSLEDIAMGRSKKTLFSAEHIIDVLGGTRAVCELTGATRNSISNWRAFDAFPARFYLVMTRALDRCGYRADPSFWSQAEAA